MRAFAFGLIIVGSSGLPVLAAEPSGPSALITRGEAVRIAVQSQLSSAPARRETDKIALLDYYSAPDRPLLWTDENGLNARGKAAVGEIAKADDYGLKASHYDLPSAEAFNPADAGATDWLAGAELKVSYAVLGYASDARGGRLQPQRLSKNLDPTLALPEPSEVISAIAIRSDPASYLRSFQPDQPQFEALRQKLLEIRGGKPAETPKEAEQVIIPEGPALKPGVVHAHVALLRKRLKIETAPDGDETLYDADVAAAVKDFQRTSGVRPDGVVGAGTRRILNGQQPTTRVAGAPSEQVILANMERWRWLPHDLGQLYVTVNIPEFMLRVVEDDEKIHETRVVVGKPHQQTPVFSDEMETVVFNPYWNVPNSIKQNEIAPYIQQGGGFFGGGYNASAVLARHGLRIRGYNGREIDPDSVDWSRVDIRRYELYMPPGPRNVLGTMKFLFPNSHDVYMHDTTQKHFFANSVRAESHGCMRVQNPDKLATLILSRDQGWDASRVASAVHGSDDNHITLKQKVPVHITYFTMKVNEDGSVSTFRDLYGHDARIIAALGGRAVPYDQAHEQVAVNEEMRPRVVKRRRGGDPINDFTRALFGF